MIRCEKIDVEDWVDAPLHGKLKTIVNCGHHLDHPKGASLAVG